MKEILNSSLIGLAVGLIVSLFRFLIQNSLSNWQLAYYHVHKDIKSLLLVMGLLLLIAWLVGKLIQKESHIMGSGIPEVELQLTNQIQLNPVSILWRKFIAGVLMIGTGSFLGREGPCVQLGAAIGQIYAEKKQLSQPEWKKMVLAGAAAGLSAAFNAPLAATLFVLEEMRHRFSKSLLLISLSSAVTADVVATFLFGLKPVLTIHFAKSLPLKYYWLLVILGLLTGLLGYLYQIVTINASSWFNRIKGLPREYHPMIMLIFTCTIGLTIPHLLGGGSDLIQSLTHLSLPMGILIIIFLIRFVISTISFGSGAPGGIFLPILTLGALIGAVIATGFADLGDLSTIFLPNFIIFAMAGYFAGISQAPLTAIILITEMVGSLVHLLPLALVALIAYLIVNLCHGAPIYESLAQKIQLQSPLKKRQR